MKMEYDMRKGRSDSSFRIAMSGRYVTAEHGNTSPHTAVRESAGSGGNSGSDYRSAISG